jgi:predicted LPLAT superfamily acyltransferase/peptidoglycan/xylan/chitin deacetylase (PgdA/CDA1 family)
MWLSVLGGAMLLTASGSVWLLPREQALLVWVVALLCFFALLARGMFSVRSSLLEETHWRSDDAGEQRVALSFDDGPHPRWTPAVLDVLKAKDVRATFFLIGENARRHPEIVKRIHDEGHEIGCHGDTHSWRTPFFGRRRLDAEINRCLDSIRTAAGVTPRLYRPPIGIRSPGNAGVAEKNDLLLIGMARRGLDPPPGRDATAFATRFVASAARGEVLALHDGEEPLHPVSREGTVAALPAVLDGLAAKGLRPVPVSALLAVRPYRESPVRGWTGRSRGGRLGMAIFAATARVFGAPGCLAVTPIVVLWTLFAHTNGRRASIGLRRRLYGKANPLREIAWVYAHFWVFARTTIDRMTFIHAKAAPPEVESTGFTDEVRDATRSSDGGCILVSAHVGDWIAASRVSKLSNRPMWVVAAQGMGGTGPHQVRRDGGKHLFNAIDVDAHPVQVGAEIAAALRAGGLVAMLGDRKVSGDTVRLPFLGADADFPTGPWAVAMVTGAPVVVFFMVRRPGGRHRIQFFGPIRVPKVGREARADAIRAGAAQFAGHLETVVRENPLQWSNFYDFWAVK